MHIFNVWTIIIQSLNIKERILLELRITQTRHLLSIWKEKCLSLTPIKNRQIFIKCALDKRCTSSMCEQSLCKVWIKRYEYCWSYKLHKLGTPLAFRMEKCLSLTPIKDKKKIWNINKKEMHLFNVWTIIMQSLNKKIWILLDLQIAQTSHLLSISDGKICLCSTPLKNEKKNETCTI